MKRRRQVTVVAALLLLTATVTQASPQQLPKATCPEIPSCGFDYRPVCGTNGITYTNDCTLSLASCTDTTLSLAHTGSCVPGLEVPAPALNPVPLPDVGAAGTGDAKCPEACTRIFLPVCASDGLTYNNPCVLDHASCLAQTKGRTVILMVAEGPCDSPGVPSADQGIQVDLGSQAPAPAPAPAPASSCNQKCTKIFMPVCGIDGNTYNNMCLLQATDCLNREAGGSGIGLAFEAACDAPGVPSAGQGTQADLGSQAPAPAPGPAPAPASSCNQNCPRIFTPVCGTNGKTYNNMCLLQVADCLDREADGRGVSLSFEAACDSGQVAGGDAALAPASSCIHSCPRNLAPVCGTNANTYNNMCLLQRADCLNREAGGNGVGLAFETACDDISTDINLVEAGKVVLPVTCRRSCTTSVQQVCGSDGVTYDNECVLEVTSCEAKQTGGSSIYLVHGGICDPEFSQRGAGRRANTGCRVSCTGNYHPVCGSDGRTYNNECVLDVFNCGIWRSGGQGTYIVKDGECGGSSDIKLPMPTQPQPQQQPAIPNGSLVSSLGVAKHTVSSPSRPFQTPFKSSSSQTSQSLTQSSPSASQFSPPSSQFSQPSRSASQPSHSSQSFPQSSLSPPEPSLFDSPAPERPCPVICTKDFRPVCGSDGQTYSNLCNLQSTSCRVRSAGGHDLVKNFDGPCVAALPQGPVCETRCDKTFLQVCGSDGETYNNFCLLMHASCLNPFADIILTSEGPCDSTLGIGGFNGGDAPGTDPVSSPTPAPFPAFDRTPDSVPSQTSSCREECTRNYHPVCGSDGNTYNNMCILDVADCQNREAGGSGVGVAFEAVCEAAPTIEHALPDAGGMRKKSCVTACPQFLQRVCGNDGNWYGNICLLEKEKCQRNPTLKKSKRSNKCAPRHAVVDARPDTGAVLRPAAPASSCNQKCTKIFMPVCGTDGNTYNNMCLLQVAGCLNREADGSDIGLAFEAACDTPGAPSAGLDTTQNGFAPAPSHAPASSCSEHCTRIFTQVCGSDGKTYNNMCLLEIADCRSREVGGRGVRLLFEDACDIRTQITTVDPATASVCNEGCTKIDQPVCGTDGHTYSNLCILMVTDCQDREAGGTGVGLAFEVPCERVVQIFDSDETDSSSMEDDDDDYLVIISSYLPPV